MNQAIEGDPAQLRRLISQLEVAAGRRLIEQHYQIQVSDQYVADLIAFLDYVEDQMHRRGEHDS